MYLSEQEKKKSQIQYPDLNQSDIGQTFTQGFSQQSGWGNQQTNPQQQPSQTTQDRQPGWNPQISQNVSEHFFNPKENQVQKHQPYQQWQQNQVINDPFQALTTSFQLNSIFTRAPVQYTFPSPFIKYKIIPMLDEKMALDVTSINDASKKLKKNNLIIWSYHGGPNQMFYIKEKQNKKYNIINVSKGFTMEIPNSSGKDGVQVHVNPRNDAQNQLWDLVQVGENEFMLRAFNGKVLDVSGQSTKNGTAVIQWKQNGGKNQRWRIVPY